MTISRGRMPVIERYWSLRFEPDYARDEKYFIERTRELLYESVNLHMVSDVPLGAFLSGGVDSSSVVAAASSMIPEPLKTFYIGFTEPAYNELEYAHQVAKSFGADQRDLVLGPDAFDELENLAWYLDEPFGDSSAIPTYMVSKLAAQHVKVVLSGDGGDELFAGYDRYVVEQRERGRAPLPGGRLLAAISRNMPAGMRGRNYLRHFALSGSERYLDSCTLFPREDLRQLFRPDFFGMLAEHEPWRAKAAQMESQGSHWLTQLQNLDINNYLPLDILTKVDRMSMAHSIETRVPLLDHKLAEFAATIPPELNLRGGTTKYILKQAMRGILPDHIIDRPKRGFAVPLNFWFRGKLNSYVRDLVLGERSRRRGIFNTPYVEGLIARNERGQNLDLQIWTLISFELWARTFLDSASTRSAAA